MPLKGEYRAAAQSGGVQIRCAVKLLRDTPGPRGFYPDPHASGVIRDPNPRIAQAVRPIPVLFIEHGPGSEMRPR